MRFGWGRGAAAIDAGDEQATESAPYELAGIELLTDEGRFVGWIATEGQRTSDWLNTNAVIPVHGLAEAPEAADASLVPPATDVSSQSPTLLERDRVVWAVPPPLPANRHLRLHRRRVLVHLELDEHEISGQAHVRPGADAVDQLLRGTRDMVPLTDVQVVSRDDRAAGFALPVLVVNRVHVRRVVVDTLEVPAAESPAASDTPVSTAEPLASTAEPPATTRPMDAPASAVDEGDGDPIRDALVTLLEAGVIDVVEFQSIRARIVVPPEHPGGRDGDSGLEEAAASSDARPSARTEHRPGAPRSRRKRSRRRR
jgi:hypothetical protein